MAPTGRQLQLLAATGRQLQPLSATVNCLTVYLQCHLEALRAVAPLGLGTLSSRQERTGRSRSAAGTRFIIWLVSAVLVKFKKKNPFTRVANLYFRKVYLICEKRKEIQFLQIGNFISNQYLFTLVIGLQS